MAHTEGDSTAPNPPSASRDVTPRATQDPGRSGADHGLRSDHDELDGTAWGWTGTDRRLLAVVGLILALGLGVHLWRKGANGGMIEIERLPESASGYRLDMNRGTWVEFAQMDGLGETLGRRIVADRETNGPFRSVDELSRVPGIGPAKLEAIRAWLIVAEADASPTAVVPPAE